MQIYSPIITGSLGITGSVVITGSLKVSSGITGSLFGTASYALNTTIFSGTNNYIPRFSGSSNLSISAIYNNGSLVGINTASPGYALDVNGTIRSNAYLYVGGGGSSEYAIEIGKDRTGNGYAYLDLTGDATYTDYGLRIIRGATGANTTSNITHRGTGTFTIETLESGSISFNTNNSRRLLIDGTGSIVITGSALKIDIPSRANGYVLTSDASGSATWQPSSGGGVSFPYSGSAVITGSLIVQTGDSEFFQLMPRSLTGSGEIQIPMLPTTIQNVQGATVISSNYLSNTASFNTGRFIRTSTPSNPASILILRNGGISVNSTNESPQSGSEATLAAIFSSTGYYGTQIFNLADGNTNRQPYVVTTNSTDYKLYYQNNPTASSAEQINTGSAEDSYIKPLELEQSKHTTINIYNFLNFS